MKNIGTIVGTVGLVAGVLSATGCKGKGGEGAATMLPDGDKARDGAATMLPEPFRGAFARELKWGNNTNNLQLAVTATGMSITDSLDISSIRGSLTVKNGRQEGTNTFLIQSADSSHSSLGKDFKESTNCSGSIEIRDKQLVVNLTGTDWCAQQLSGVWPVSDGKATKGALSTKNTKLPKPEVPNDKWKDVNLAGVWKAVNAVEDKENPFDPTVHNAAWVKDWLAALKKCQFRFEPSDGSDGRSGWVGKVTILDGDCDWLKKYEKAAEVTFSSFAGADASLNSAWWEDMGNDRSYETTRVTMSGTKLVVKPKNRVITFERVE